MLDDNASFLTQKILGTMDALMLDADSLNMSIDNSTNDFSSDTASITCLDASVDSNEAHSLRVLHSHCSKITSRTRERLNKNVNNM